MIQDNLFGFPPSVNKSLGNNWTTSTIHVYFICASKQPLF